MLVLSRKQGQTICIGDDIRVMVTLIGEGKVKLGIEAPKDTAVHREEVKRAIDQGHTVKRSRER